jgi:hypothetical protein
MEKNNPDPGEVVLNYFTFEQLKIRRETMKHTIKYSHGMISYDFVDATVYEHDDGSLSVQYK